MAAFCSAARARKIMRSRVRRVDTQLELGLGIRRRNRTEPSPTGQPHTLVGLFAGIGGLEAGLHRAGHDTVLFCENDPTANAVLRSKFPEVAVHTDIRSLRVLPPSATLVSAGFPCQDLSQAGQTAGISGAQS